MKAVTVDNWTWLNFLKMCFTHAMILKSLGRSSEKKESKKNISSDYITSQLNISWFFMFSAFKWFCNFYCSPIKILVSWWLLPCNKTGRQDYHRVDFMSIEVRMFSKFPLAMRGVLAPGSSGDEPDKVLKGWHIHVEVSR